MMQYIFKCFEPSGTKKDAIYFKSVLNLMELRMMQYIFKCLKPSGTKNDAIYFAILYPNMSTANIPFSSF